MIDSLKQRMLDFIKQNQPVTEQQLKDGLGISRHSCRENRGHLRNAGLIYVTCGSGSFISRADYENWLENGGGHEKISNTAKKGIHKFADSTARIRVIEYLTSLKEPVCAGEIAIACHLMQKTAYRILASLADDGTIVHDGRVKNRHYLIASPDAQFPSSSGQQGEKKTKAFVRYNPKKNGVVQAYMASPARQRLMAVYGMVG